MFETGGAAHRKGAIRPDLDTRTPQTRGPRVALPVVMTNKTKDGIEVLTDTAKKVFDGAKQKAKDAKRAVRDVALHTNDKIQDFKDRLN
jgi:hypothetical protein